MYNTLEIYKEMLEIGMIDQEEYNDMVNQYHYHVNALMRMNKDALEEMEFIKEQKKRQSEGKTSSKPKSKYEKLCEMYATGFIDEETFTAMKSKLLLEEDI